MWNGKPAEQNITVTGVKCVHTLLPSFYFLSLFLFLQCFCEGKNACIFPTYFVYFAKRRKNGS